MASLQSTNTPQFGASVPPTPTPAPQQPPGMIPLAQSTRPPTAPQMAAPGKPADANPWQVSPVKASTPAAASPTPIPLATAPGATPYANTSATVPGSATDYTGQTITPGPGVDRLALAKSNFEDFAKSSEPEFQASLREANQAGYGRGQGGSGMLRGRLGDIGVTRARDLESSKTRFLNDATAGSIDDNYRNIGIATQQQGRQDSQQQTAFDQAQRTKAMEEALRNGDFQRYYQLLQAGSAGSPVDTQLALAGNYGNQSSAAGASAGSLAAGAVRNPYTLPLAS